MTAGDAQASLLFPALNLAGRIFVFLLSTVMNPVSKVFLQGIHSHVIAILIRKEEFFTV